MDRNLQNWVLEVTTLKLNNVFSSFFVNSFTFFDDLQYMEGAEGNTEICEIIKTGKNLNKKNDNKSCST